MYLEIKSQNDLQFETDGVVWRQAIYIGRFVCEISFFGGI